MDVRDPVVDETGSIAIHGDFDMETADGVVGDALRRAAETGSGPVVVDMSGVTFMDSQGLNALLSARFALADRGRLLVLRRPPRTALRVLDVCGVTELFSIEP